MLTLTVVYNDIERVIETEVTVKSQLSDKEVRTWGVWDTGAVTSAITCDIADRLNLHRKESSRLIQTVQGYKIVDIASVKLSLSDSMEPLEIEVLIIDNIGDYKERGVLIGMDIISKGAFAISNIDGATTFSFMMPTVVQIDFHEMMNRIRRKKKKD